MIEPCVVPQNHLVIPEFGSSVAPDLSFDHSIVRQAQGSGLRTNGFGVIQVKRSASNNPTFSGISGW